MSPLRYPGGKGQLYARLESLIRDNNLAGKTYVEPFAGGFSVGLNLLINRVISRAIINDYDYRLFCFWSCIFKHTEELIKIVENTPVTIDEWHRQRAVFLSPHRASRLSVALSTLFLNRTNFSGILGARPIGGLQQSGALKLDCRFRKSRILAQLKTIGEFRESVQVYNLDALQFVKEIIIPQQKKLFINFDPPYVQQGKALYANFYTDEDHRRLASYISRNLKGDWIMTYDAHPLIYQIYAKYNIKPFYLNYNAKGARRGEELFIAPKDYKRDFAT